MTDENEGVFFYILFINEKYVWLYENCTRKTFRATFRFELTNLKIEDDEDKAVEVKKPKKDKKGKKVKKVEVNAEAEEEASEKPADEWDLNLEPDETGVKVIARVDPKVESKYRSSYSYAFANE